MRIRDFIGTAAGRSFAGRLPVIAAVTLAPGAAFAQQAPARQFSISPQLRLEHDTNVLRLPDGVAPANGFRRSDYRSSPQVAVNIVRPIGRQSVFLTGLVGYDFYRYNKQLERERIALTGGGSASRGNCTANGQVSYSRRQSDLDDIILGGFGRGRNLQKTWTPSVGISCGTGGGISSSLGYTHEDVENSDPFRSFGNYKSDTYNAQVGLNRPVIGNLGVYTNYRRGSYDNRFLPDGRTELVKSYSTGLRLDRQFGRITGHVSGGVTRVESNAPGVRGFSGGTYDASLSYAGPRATAQLGFGRNIQQSNLIGVSYSVVDSLNLGLTYRLTSRIDLNAGASVVKRRLTQSPLVPQGPLGPLFIGNQNDRLRTVNVGASVAAARHISFDLGAIWRQRRGDSPIFDYNARILALTLRLH